MEFSLPQGADYFLSLPKKNAVYAWQQNDTGEKIVVFSWWELLTDHLIPGSVMDQYQDLLHMVMMRLELVEHLAMVILWCASFHGNEDMTSIKSFLSLKRWINVMTNLTEKKKDGWSVVFWSEMPLGFLGSYDMQYHASCPLKTSTCSVLLYLHRCPWWH